MTQKMEGIVYGNSIDAVGDVNLCDGDRVVLTIEKIMRRTEPWGEGINRSAGVAADVPDFDEIFEKIERERKSARFRELSE